MDSTGLAILLGMFFVGFMVCLIVVPKTHGPNGIEHNPIYPTRGEYRVLWTAVICYYGLIIFAGEQITAFIVSHGLVLSP